MNRFTHKNPDGSFRAPLEWIGEFRLNQCGSSLAVYGDLVNRLGQYEDLISLEELQKMKKSKK